MKILMIHNEYAAISGEEVQFYNIADILKKNGHDVLLYTRSSFEVGGRIGGKIRAFFAGIYNPFSKRKISLVASSFNIWREFSNYCYDNFSWIYYKRS